MTDRKLRAALLGRLDISKQALSNRVQNLKKDCPMATEDAVYCIAHQEGLKLDKYLPRETVDRVRTLLGHLPGTKLQDWVKSRGPKTIVKTRSVSVGGELDIDDPILPEGRIEEARRMAGKVYPMLYVFENSVREVIQRMMTKRDGQDWWNKAKIASDIRREVIKRQQKEDEEAWHGKRNAHPIHYTDIGHLISLVTSNWTAFKNIFPRQDWFANIVLTMEISRNTVAHMNPLGPDDTHRVRLNLRDWQRQIAAKKDLVS